METLDSGGPPLASMFHYHVTRFDNQGSDASGFLFLEDGLSTITNNGVCDMALHNPPVTEQGAQVMPSSAAYTDGASRALGRRNLRLRYAAADGLSRVAWAREQLRQNKPVVIGFHLPSTCPDGFLDSSFSWLDPNAFTASGTGYCVLAFGQ
jgi:hypothetical protein